MGVGEVIVQVILYNVMKWSHAHFLFIVLQVLDCNVTGEWHSELGSQLQLSTVGPEVRGVYRTVLESTRGAAGPNREAKVVGVISDGPQPTIAFSALWAKGNADRKLFSVTCSNTPDSLIT